MISDPNFIKIVWNFSEKPYVLGVYLPKRGLVSEYFKTLLVHNSGVVDLFEANPVTFDRVVSSPALHIDTYTILYRVSYNYCRKFYQVVL